MTDFAPERHADDAVEAGDTRDKDALVDGPNPPASVPSTTRVGQTNSLPDPPPSEYEPRKTMLAWGPVTFYVPP